MQTMKRYRSRLKYGPFWTDWKAVSEAEAQELIRWVSTGYPYWQIEETTLEVIRQVVIHGEVEDGRFQSGNVGRTGGPSDESGEQG
jgi:NTP pyrophosphatase (non-canonical NTP hydrolase)